AARLTLSGQSVEVAAPVGSFLDRAMFWVSRNGTIVSTTAASVLSTQLTWVDRRGEVLSTVGEPGPYANVALSPTGTHAALIQRDYASGSSNNELWLWDLA